METQNLVLAYLGNTEFDDTVYYGALEVPPDLFWEDDLRIRAKKSPKTCYLVSGVFVFICFYLVFVCQKGNASAGVYRILLLSIGQR